MKQDRIEHFKRALYAWSLEHEGLLGLGDQQVLAEHLAAQPMTVNLNDRVSVTLTEEGVRVFRKHWQDLGLEPAALPADRRVTLHMWELLMYFGYNTFMGGPTLFVRNAVELEALSV